MTGTVSLAGYRAERDWRDLQHSVRQEFAQILSAAFSAWQEAHQHMAAARDRSAVIHALVKCRYGQPLSEKDLKRLRDTLMKWEKQETHPSVKEGLQASLELIAREGKHVMGYGKVECLKR